MCGLAFALTAPSAAASLQLRLLAALTPRGPDAQSSLTAPCGPSTTALLCAAVLHMRGARCTPQPLTLGPLALCYNGELFGGALAVPPGASDTTALGRALQAALEASAGCGGGGGLAAVLAVAQALQGPFALLLWDAPARTLYFARDALGRRSLLWALPQDGDQPQLEPQPQPVVFIGSAAAEGLQNLQEVPPRGVYALRPLGSGGGGGGGALWQSACLGGWELVLAPYAAPAFPPRAPRLACLPGAAGPPLLPAAALALAAQALLRALSAAVRVRVACNDGGGSGIGGGGGGGSIGDCTPPAPPTPAAPPLPAPEPHLYSFPAGAPRPPVSQALAALALARAPPPPPPPGPPAPLAILFSGGLDCMVLAALTHAHAPRHHAIDLITVDFSPSRDSPDRLSALDGLAELTAACPGRAWNLVCVDEAYSAVVAAPALAVTAGCVAPLQSHLDYNLAFVLGAGARGVGYLHRLEGGGAAAAAAEVESARGGEGGEEAAQLSDEELWARIEQQVAAPFAQWRAAAAAEAEAAGGSGGGAEATAPSPSAPAKKPKGKGKGAKAVAAGAKARADAEEAEAEVTRDAKKRPPPPPSPPAPSLLVRSAARVLLSGLGADELLGGYGRHRSAAARGGWAGLARELQADAERLWARNLGRDDRVIAWHGREARWPYLDEGAVLPCLAALPLHALCDFREGAGAGDKRLLRRVAAALGLPRAAARVKRAMHFGSHCVRHSDAAAAAAAAAAAGEGGGGSGGSAVVHAGTPFMT